MRNDDYQEHQVPVKPYSVIIDGNLATEAYRRARISAIQQQERLAAMAAESSYSSYDEYEEPVVRERASKKSSAKPKKKAKKKAKVQKVYTARKPLLYVLAVLMVVAVVVNILPIVGLVPEYTAAFMSKNSEGEFVGTSLADPAMSLISYLTGGDGAYADDDMFTQTYYRDCLSQLAEESETPTEEDGDGTIDDGAAQAAEVDDTAAEDTATDAATEKEAAEKSAKTTKLICYIALPLLVILFAIITIYIAIKAVVAAVKGVKYKFGFSLLVGILYLLGIAVLTMVWNGVGQSEIINVLTQGLSAFGMDKVASKAALGFGFYITAIIYVLAFIVNIFAYRSEKIVKKGRR